MDVSHAPRGDSVANKPEPPSGVWQEVQPFIDGLAEQAAFIDQDGIILAVNRHWRRQVEQQARHGLHISRDYDAYLTELLAEGDQGVRPVLEAFRAIRAGSEDSFQCLYRGAGAFSGYDFKVVITAMEVHGDRYVLVTVHDVTELVSLKRQKRRLGSQLLHAQDAERRRLARDLHDSTAQALVALQLSINGLGREHLGPKAEILLMECQEAIQEMHREIRAISFIAHPPSTSGVGIKEAIESLVGGFARRTGLGITVECPELAPISPLVEATLFRLTQEALANMRHASAGNASVRLIEKARHLHLLIRDDGVGFEWPAKSAPRSMGVGVLGMAERVRELGGRLSLIRLEKGTLMRASLPRSQGEFAPC